MKLALLALLSLLSFSALADQTVRGYTRKDGTSPRRDVWECRIGKAPLAYLPGREKADGYMHTHNRPLVGWQD